MIEIHSLRETCFLDSPQYNWENARVVNISEVVFCGKPTSSEFAMMCAEPNIQWAMNHPPRLMAANDRTLPNNLRE
jgi:hypothetical protein